MHLTESDEAIALVNGEVERALEPFVDLLSPADLEAMRAYLIDVALLHPTLSELVSRLVPRHAMLESGEVGEALEREEATKAKLNGGSKSG